MNEIGPAVGQALEDVGQACGDLVDEFFKLVDRPVYIPRPRPQIPTLTPLAPWVPTINPFPTNTPTPTPGPNKIVVRFVKYEDYVSIQSGMLPVVDWTVHATTPQYLLDQTAGDPNSLSNPAVIAGLVKISADRAGYFVAFYRKFFDNIPGVQIRRDNPMEVKWYISPNSSGMKLNDPDQIDISSVIIDRGKTEEKMSASYLYWLLSKE